MILLQPEKIPIEYKTAHGITGLAKGGRVTEDNWLRIYSYLQPSYFTRLRLKCLCRLFNDVEELISNYKYNKWTVNMIAQDITANTDVTVTQGTAVGTLRKKLTGVGMTSVVIDAAFGVVFQDNLDVVIGTGGTAATITHVNITSATVESNPLPLFSPLEPIPLYTSFPHPNYASLRGLTTCLNALSKKEPDNVPSLLLIADGVHSIEIYKDEYGDDCNYAVIDFPITIIGESKDGCTIIGGLKIEGKEEDDVTVKHLTISQSKGNGVNGDGGMSFHLFHLNIEKSEYYGVVVGGTKRNTMSNCQVSHSKYSGVRVWDGLKVSEGGLITINGSGTSIHNNVTGGDSDHYGLCTHDWSSTIHLVSPLTKESVSINNGGGGNCGGFGTIKIID